MNDLSSRVALITGASSGIGRAIAKELAAAGAKTVLVARRKAELDEVAAEIAARGGTALVAPADITVEAQVIGAFEAAMARFGRLDLLVNNAGIADHTPTAELSLALWQKVIDINLTAVFLCCGVMLAQPPKTARLRMAATALFRLFIMVSFAGRRPRFNAAAR